jgi:hypothetical protein
VFDAPTAVSPEAIKTQTVDRWVDFCDQSIPERCPLSRIDFAFEDGILHALPEIETSSGHTAQAAAADDRLSAHVIGYEHEHGVASLPNKAGIAVKVAAQVSGKELRLQIGNET